MSWDLARHCRSVLHDQFEELRPVSVAYLGEGCDSVAFEVNGQFVFRFPKKADVEQQFSIEARLLPVLARVLPLPVPHFSFFGKPTPEFPRHFVGYRKLPGTPAIHVDVEHWSPTHLAPAIGDFVSALHAYPIEKAVALGVPRQSLASLIEETRNDALDDLDLLAQVVPQAPVAELHSYLQHPPRPSFSALVLVHNDLAAEHILLDDARRHVTGVIDWGDAAISAPATDFAGMFHWGGPAFAEVVLANYQGAVDNDLRATATFMAVCRGVMDIRFGCEFNRPEYVRAGQRALQLCHNPRDLEPR